MTKDRDFKKLVRERMARTGESYAAARAQLARDESEPAGKHAETAALVRLLVHAGITGPARAAPTEALVLGLGGGIGAASFTFEYKGHPPTFYVATRCHPQYAYDTDFVRAAAERLGAASSIAESSSPTAAVKRLRDQLAKGPAMVWVDAGGLPWARKLGGAADLGAMPHVIVVERIEDELAIVRDTPGRPFAIALPALAAARKRLRAGKHRVLGLARAEAPDWRTAFRDAIAACAAGLRGKTKIKGPMAKNFGVPGLRRWATALVDPKDKKSWTRVFTPQYAASNLAWTRHWIEHAGTGGGGFRPMYAEFLEVAATALPALKPIARDYRVLGTQWSSFATALLPDRVPRLAAIRRAQDGRHTAYLAGDLDAMRAAEERTKAAIAAAASQPLEADDLRAHYAELGTRLSAIVDAEEACAARLATATT